MSEKAKQMAVLFIGALVVGGVIMLQVRRSRPTGPATATQQVVVDDAGIATPLPPVAVTTPDPTVDAVTLPTNIALPQLTSGGVGETEAPPDPIVLFAGQWGRNPFLTIDEIAALNFQPEPVLIVEEIPPPPIAEAPAALPVYTIASILTGPNGVWATLGGGQILRIGDRIGPETVRNITDRGVVFESNLGTREVLFQGPSLTQTVPPGE
jgi:hypothetical protein